MGEVVTVPGMRVVGGLALIFIALALWLTQTAINRDDISPFKQSGLALQLSGSAAIVKKVVGDENSKDRALLKTSLKNDFVFILSYASLFVALGLLLSQARASGALWLGLASAVAVLAAAGFDLVENSRALHILSLPTDSITDTLCGRLTQASMFKWFFFFLTIGLQSLILLELANWYWLIGVGMIISAILGLVGLRFHGLIPLANLGLAAPILGIAAILVVIPHWFIRFFK